MDASIAGWLAVLVVSGLVLVLLPAAVRGVLGGRPGSGTRSGDYWQLDQTGPSWTEDLGGNGLRYGRAFSVNDSLMRVDAMARRGEIHSEG